MAMSFLNPLTPKISVLKRLTLDELSRARFWPGAAAGAAGFCIGLNSSLRHPKRTSDNPNSIRQSVKMSKNYKKSDTNIEKVAYTTSILTV